MPPLTIHHKTECGGLILSTYSVIPKGGEAANPESRDA
jgi:hypothetical protein